MKILLAIDGSAPSRRAADLVAAMRWPHDSQIRVVVVDESEKQLDAVPWLGEPVFGGSGPSWPHSRELNELASATAARLAAPGRTIETAVPRGWAAEEIVREAAAWPADLVVVGSHGHGFIASALLGSVSARVVDHAPCPVLVARTTTSDRIVVGVDGSRESDHAVEWLARHELFPGARVQVVGAVRFSLPLGALAPATAAETAAYAEQVAEARQDEAAAVDDASIRLASLGRLVGTTIRDGEPSHVLLEAASSLGADVIVVGTRGHTGFERVLLGSVAHRVLLHAAASVLVVRPSVSVGRPADRETMTAAGA